MDWEVQVITKDMQIKNVKVYDYNYPSDAQRAALCQTGADRVIWCQPYTPNTNNESTSTYDSGYSEPEYIYVDYDYDYSKPEDNIAGYIVATLLPSALLWIVHPFLCIVFNVFFARWWFID